MVSTIGKSAVEVEIGQRGVVQNKSTRFGPLAKRIKFLFSLVLGVFDLATDLAMGFDLLKENEVIGQVALVFAVAPYWVPGWIALTYSLSQGLCTEIDYKKPTSVIATVVMVAFTPILGFFFGGIMLGCGLFVGFHMVRFVMPFGLVPEPPDDWQFDICDNSHAYMGWFVELVIGFWVSVVEDIPECIIAAVVIFGGTEAGDVNIAMLSAAVTIVNFIWGAFKVGQTAVKHNVPFMALLTAHVIRKTTGHTPRVRNARAMGRARR